MDARRIRAAPGFHHGAGNRVAQEHAHVPITRRPGDQQELPVVFVVSVLRVVLRHVQTLLRDLRQTRPVETGSRKENSPHTPNPHLFSHDSLHGEDDNNVVDKLRGPPTKALAEYEFVGVDELVRNGAHGTSRNHAVIVTDDRAPLRVNEVALGAPLRRPTALQRGREVRVPLHIEDSEDEGLTRHLLDLHELARHELRPDRRYTHQLPSSHRVLQKGSMYV
mmetsp:Transcript_36400/g.116660  ORF Transcript_36400/g.116660 Transcript_36400/m.116660 type:complete len:222 (+) Transcript_36400:993-1658(+)